MLSYFFSVLNRFVFVAARPRAPFLTPQSLTFCLPFLIAAVLLLQVREGSKEPLVMRSW